MKRPTALIVEDESIIAMELEQRVENLGFDVVGLVSSGEAAVEAACAKMPDVILMDIRLAGAMDGIDAAAKIRSAHGTPVIFLTSHSDPATVARAEATSPAGYLAKPFDEDQLRVALSTAIESAVAFPPTEIGGKTTGVN